MIRLTVVRAASACVFIGPALSLPADTTPPVPTRLTLFSSTVAQSLTRTAQGPKDLVTTYYQAELDWPLDEGLGVHAEAEGGQVIGDEHDRSLSNSLGTAYKLNDMQEDPRLNVPTLYLFGSFDAAHLRWNAGKIGQDALYDDNRAARSKRRKFLALPFTRNPSVPFPSKGLGGSITWSPLPRAALTVGAGDANAIGTKTGFTTLRGEWFRAAELLVRPYEKSDVATFRFMRWTTERRGVRDQGWALSADHELGRSVVAFLRWGTGSEHFARVRQFVGGGLAWEAPWGRPQDFLGIASSRGVSVATGRTEHLTELVYRWQPTPNVAISPDVQYIDHPARSDVSSAVAFGVRFAVTFRY